MYFIKSAVNGTHKEHVSAFLMRYINNGLGENFRVQWVSLMQGIKEKNVTCVLLSISA